MHGGTGLTVVGQFFILKGSCPMLMLFLSSGFPNSTPLGNPNSFSLTQLSFAACVQLFLTLCSWESVSHFLFSGVPFQVEFSSLLG